MRLRDVTALAFESVAANRFRSALTMLGMGIGVFSVITLVALGQGARNYVLKEFNSLGSNFIVVQPGKVDKRGAFGPPPGAAQTEMTIRDVVALERKALNLGAVSGLILGTVEIKRDELVSNISVFGVNEQFQHILTMEVAQGDFITREEVEFGRRNVVLGANIAENLFPFDYPIGRSVKLNGSEFRVTGVLAAMGSKLGFNIDDFALIPTSSAQRLFNDDKLFGIRARASGRSSVDDAVAEIKEILRDRRNGEENFSVITQMAIVESMDSILGMLSYVLGGIAAISMLVGGIGIMNIMLVSVAERIPEIGIRRAVGARRADILQQFLVEALALSILSGAAGLLVALGLTHGMSWYYGSFDMRPPWWIVVGAFTISVIVGVVFGLWPARKASRIETLDALRHE
jgi:putative ABC transport system permease protein